MSRRAAITTALLVLALPRLGVAADTLIYVRASSQLDRAGDPSAYHPLNLLDDDADTLWCEGASDLGEGAEVRYYFRAPQRIDRIVIGPSPKSGRLIEAVTVSDGHNTARIALDGQYVEQRIEPPLEGDTYVLTIARVLGPNKEAKLANDVACLADALFYYQGRLFGGRTPAGKLRYDRMRDLVLGPWNGAPFGAPESTFTFGLDGTWEWVFKPLLGRGGETIRGEYRFRDAKLLMRRGETGHWRDVGFIYRRIKVDPNAYSGPTTDYDRIHITGAIAPKMAGDYDNAQF